MDSRSFCFRPKASSFNMMDLQLRAAHVFFFSFLNPDATACGSNQLLCRSKAFKRNEIAVAPGFFSSCFFAHLGDEICLKRLLLKISTPKALEQPRA